jgi:hypothetical protein
VLWLKKLGLVSHQNDRKIPRAVGAKDEDPLDITGSAGTRNEGRKTGIVIAILYKKQLKSSWEIRQ